MNDMLLMTMMIMTMLLIITVVIKNHTDTVSCTGARVSTGLLERCLVQAIQHGNTYLANDGVDDFHR